jgi:hypothetical protein
MDARNSSDAWDLRCLVREKWWNICRKIIRKACRAFGENCKAFRSRRINPNQTSNQGRIGPSRHAWKNLQLPRFESHLIWKFAR